MLLDRFAPEYEFSERHETLIQAPLASVFRAIKEVTVAEIPMFHGLFTLRSLPERLTRRGRAGGESTTTTAPLLQQMYQHGFVLLGEEPERELVFGTIQQFWKLRHNQVVEVNGPDEFASFEDPQFGKAVMNFLLHAGANDAGGVRLTTETRIAVPNPEAQRKFALYWRMAMPGSALIRRMWLRAIKRRAERA